MLCSSALVRRVTGRAAAAAAAALFRAYHLEKKDSRAAFIQTIPLPVYPDGELSRIS